MDRTCPRGDYRARDARCMWRHEVRLTERGAVMRLGTAWRIVEPTFHPVLFEILGEERECANKTRP